jgi:GNAT superfamily N-acetyltransferase
MSGEIRDMVSADIPALSTLLQSAYAASHSYERRLNDALENRSSRTFVIDGDDGPVAMGTLHDYVTMGYVALMGVAPEQQRQGYGRRLMEAIVAESDRRQNTVLALESSEAGRRLYDALGFSQLGITLGLAGQCAAGPIADERVRRATPDDRGLIAAYDAVAFGGDRSDTIAGWFRDDTCAVFIADDGDHVGGYSVARERRIGPWIAQSPGAAAALFDAARAALDGSSAVVYVPEENLSALAILGQRGWTPRTRNMHMARGAATHVPRRTIYGLISLGEG